jgi:lactate racemase
VRIDMKYGKTGLAVDLGPDLEIDVIRKKAMPVLADAEAGVASAWENPVGCGPLYEEARRCKSACILICDITRPVPNGIVLPSLVKELLAAGIAPGSVTILVATGLHRPNLGEELREVIGSDWVMETVSVVNHYARNDEDHRHLGDVSGIPVRIDRRFLDADLRIAVGLVEPHFMAGYSGGRKLVAPGVAHEETIRMLHAAGILEDCRAANCILEGNPLHNAQMAILGMAGECFAVNCVIDEERRLSCVNFGAMVASHLDAVAFVRPYAEIPVKRKYLTVLTSAAGYPLDKNYYQTVKGMVGAMDIVADGGTLIITSECSEGLGSAEYAAAQERLLGLGSERLLAELLGKRSAAVDEWQTEMQVRAMKKARVWLYTEGLSPDERRLTGVRIVSAVEAAVGESVAMHGERRIAVIPEGPYVIPVYQGP